MGVFSSRGFACNSGGDKAEIFSTPCVLWHNRYNARYHYGNQCLRKGACRTPDEAIRSPEFHSR
ncbi:hypothetical protein Golob_005352 [Gossypium lobatum]|uniref:Uncharacterized protein n=1 Tax=Gossypium lobatum TaxID=34289 RepID=A0A7J8MSW4_9ROSI|nr:hypothetical protein [Gossypium lobatum]